MIMTSRLFRPRVYAAVLAFALALPVPAASQNAGDLFDPSVMQEIRLTINTRDLRLIRERYAENTYYTADLQWQNIRVRNAGVRSRGSASRNPDKLGLRVDFDRYVTGQRFLGLKSVVLKNMWQDGSFMHEALAMTFFARMGQAAPRVSFCRLYINNEFQGLYGIVESIDNRSSLGRSARTTAISTPIRFRNHFTASISAMISRPTSLASSRRATSVRPTRCSIGRSTTGCER